MKRTRTLFLMVVCSAVAALGAASTRAADPTADKGLSLKPARKIEFSTQEGTWLSLDVSPDGRTVIFELLGDLYTLSIDGGEAHGWSMGQAFDSQPVYSPDGKQVAFLSDRSGSENLWLANADGTGARALTRDEDDRTFVSPAWSADGQYVYVSRSIPSFGIYELWMYHVRGGSGVQITSASGGAGAGAGKQQLRDSHSVAPVDARPNSLGAVASPDGKYLYHAAKLGGFEYNAELPMWSIARRDLTNGSEDTIITAPGSAMRPVLSPDGNSLVYATRYNGQTGLRLRNLDNGEDRWLAYPVQHDEQEANPTRDLMPRSDFTPDGQSLVFSRDGKLWRLNIQSGTSRQIPFTARIALDVGADLYIDQKVPSDPVQARVIQTPRQSPDGTTLAYSALGHVYVQSLQPGSAASTARRLTNAATAEFHPSWSNDGRWLAYVTWTANGGHVWRSRADGSGKPQQLTRTAGFYSDPLFAPDGKTIFALRSSNYARTQMQSEIGNTRVADLVRIDVASGETTLVSHAVGARSPHFSADAQRLYFYSEAGLQSVRLDGGERRVHLQIKGLGMRVFPDPVSAIDARLSPDGKWALALLSTQLHLIAVPQTGAAGFVVNLAQPAVPHRRVTDIGADYFAWADGGKTLTWSLGSTFYRLPLDKVEFDSAGVPSAPEASADAADPAATATKSAPAVVPTSVTPQSFKVNVEIPRDHPAGTLVLRGATVITLRGDEVLADADVVVSNGRIISVGARGAAAVPADASVRDVSGRFIVPGFIDTHAHWFEIRRGVLEEQNWSFLANLAYGVTSGLDVQPFTSDMFVYEDLIDAGLMIGPRAFSTGPGMFSDNRLASRTDALNLLSRYRDHYGTRNLKSYVIGNRRERQLVVEAAHELGMMPTTEGALDFKLDLTHALDGFAGNEHALPNAPIYDDVVQLFARSGIGYTITGLVAYGGPFGEEHFFITQRPDADPKVRRFMPAYVIDQRSRRHVWFRDQDQIYPQIAAQAAKILRAGGRIGVGSHGQFQGLGYHWEMQALAAGGLTPMEVLRAATTLGAQIIGRPSELGSIEPGKLADLLILERDPRLDIRNTLSLREVLKNGRLYDADTLDERWPRQRALPPQWFQLERLPVDRQEPK